MSAIVFNCHYNGLSIIQELGRRGVEVLALDSARSVGTFSRYGKFYHCPDPQTNEESFIEFLIDLGPRFNIKPVLFPTNDHWAIAVSKHKNVLSSYYEVCAPDYETTKLIVLKQKFYDWALQQGYPAPKSWDMSMVEDIPENAFPLAAKPEYRRISSNDIEAGKRARLLDSMRLTLIKNKDELNQYIQKNKKLLSNIIFQEYVNGLSDCMYTVGVYANRDNEVLGLFSGRKVRGFPPDIGDCIVGQVEDVPTYIKDMVKRMCKEINFHGIGEFEFKRDSITQEFKLIEINPRSWSWVGITPYCGVSLPWIAYQDLTGNGNIKYQESCLKDGSIKWVKIIPDFINCRFRNRTAGYPSWSKNTREWWQSLKSEKLVVADLTINDPLPSLYSILATLKPVVRYLYKKKA